MELGSEFNLSLTDLTIKQSNVVSYLNSCSLEKYYLDSGRSALKIARDFLIPEGDILLPEYICESVINCFPRNQIRFYKITENFEADVESIKSTITTNTKAILLMHYFGVLQPLEILEQIKNLAKENRLTIIEDITHSLFTSTHTIGDCVVGSLRKWMPIPHGGILLSPKEIDPAISNCGDNYKSYGMILKDLFLKGGYDFNREYRKIFSDCEAALDRQENVYSMSDFAKYILNCVDVDFLVQRRKKNYKFLKELLLEMGIKPAIEADADDCPLAMPIRVPQRDKFRNYLIDKKVYCAVHWPFDGIDEQDRPVAKKNSQELISLPIDQRYSEEDIRYLAKIIGGYGGKLTF